MSYKKLGYVRGGLAVGGYSVAKFKDDKSGKVKICLMRNGRSVARKEFASQFEFTLWYTGLLGRNELDGHDTIIKLTDALK